jgi:hypothetical protein
MPIENSSSEFSLSFMVDRYECCQVCGDHWWFEDIASRHCRLGRMRRHGIMAGTGCNAYLEPLLEGNMVVSQSLWAGSTTCCLRWGLAHQCRY